jgi:hypothetical protein
MKISIDFWLSLRVFGLKVQIFVHFFSEFGPCYWFLLKLKPKFRLNNYPFQIELSSLVIYEYKFLTKQQSSLIF